MVKNTRIFDGKIYEIMHKIYGKQTAEITAEEMRDNATNARIVSAKEGGNDVFYIYGRKREEVVKTSKKSKQPKIVVKNHVFEVKDIMKHDGDTFVANGTTYTLKIEGGLAGYQSIWHGDEYVLYAVPMWENKPLPMMLLKKEYYESGLMDYSEDDECIEGSYDGKVRDYEHYVEIIKDFVTKSTKNNDKTFDLDEIKSGFGSMDDIIEVKGMTFEGMLDGEFVVWCNDKYALYATPNWEGHSVAFQLMNIVTNEDGFLTYKENEDGLGSFNGKVRDYKHYKQLVENFLTKTIKTSNNSRKEKTYKKMYLIDYTNKQNKDVYGLAIGADATDALKKMESKFGKSDSFENIEFIGDTSHFMDIKNIKSKLCHVTYTNSNGEHVSVIVSMKSWMPDDYDKIVKKIEKKYGKVGYDFKCTMLFDKSNLAM